MIDGRGPAMLRGLPVSVADPNEALALGMLLPPACA